MPFVHTLVGTPPPRFDGLAWTQGRIEESPDNVTFTPRETLALAPLDADPTSPSMRELTTDQATLASGWYRIVWIDAAGSQSPPSQSVRSPGSGDDGYPTRDALVAASSVVELTSLGVSDLDALRASAIDAIEAFCGQSFVAEGSEIEPVVKGVDGSGTDELYLPKRLAALTGVSHDGYAMNLADLTRAESGARLTMVNPVGGSWVTRVRRSPGEPGPVWNTGRANVAVEGVWGWTEAEWAAGMLSEVETAIRFDMEDQALADAHKLAATVRSARSLGVDNLSQGGLSMALRAGEAGLSVRAQRKLLALRWVGRVGASV